MQNTQWQPTGEAADKVKRELSCTIRANLPAMLHSEYWKGRNA